MTEAAKKQEESKKEERIEPLSVRRISRFNVQGSEFIVTVKPETELKEVLKPEYWTHVAGQSFIGELNYVHVVWEDRSQLARLYVRDYSHAYAAVEVLEHFDFRKNKVVNLEEKEMFEVKWTGPKTKYKIIRKSDDSIMAEGMINKEEALKKASEMEKAHR